MLQIFRLQPIHRSRPGMLGSLLVGFIAVSLFSACKKETLVEGNPSTIQVFNALDDRIQLKINLTGTHPIRYASAKQISNKSFSVRDNLIFSKESTQRIDFYSSRDTMPSDKPVVGLDMSLQQGEIYSLFVYGNQIKGKHQFVKESLPKINRQDSTGHIRFANFSESQAISINLVGEEAGSTVAKLETGELSDFHQLSAKQQVADKRYEIRNYATGEVLLTYTTSGLGTIGSAGFFANMWRFRANTIVISGRPGEVAPNNLTSIRMTHR